MGPCSVTSIYHIIPLDIFCYSHDFPFLAGTFLLLLYSHEFLLTFPHIPKNTFPLYIYICIFPSYSIIFPLCFHYIPIILCPLYYVISMILSIPTILQLCITYIYTHISVWLPWYPYIVSYYILLIYIYIHFLNSLYNWIIFSLCSKHIPMIYPRFSPFQGSWSSASLWTAPRLAETSFPSRTCRWSCDVMVILPTGFSMIEKWDLRVSLRWFKGIYNGGLIGIKRILWLFYGVWWWFKASFMVFYDDNGYIRRL